MDRVESLARESAFVMYRRDGRVSAGGGQIGHCEVTGEDITVGDDFDDEIRGMRQQLNSRRVGLACG